MVLAKNTRSALCILYTTGHRTAQQSGNLGLDGIAERGVAVRAGVRNWLSGGATAVRDYFAPRLVYHGQQGEQLKLDVAKTIESTF